MTCLQSPRLSPEGKCRASVWGRWEGPHLRTDQGLKAGLEVVEAAAVEPWHLVQELLVLGLEVIPHGPKLFSGLGNETLAVMAVTDLSSVPDGSSVCACAHTRVWYHDTWCLGPTAAKLVPR